MATERDDYELNVQQAVTALQDLARKYTALNEEVEESKKKHESLAEVFKKDLKESFLTATAQYDLLKEAFREGIAVVKEGIAEYLKSEQATVRLSFALRNVTKDTQGWTETLRHQAEEIERNTGVNDAYVSNLHSMLLTMGVGVNELERFTQAAFDLADATGQDATTAARMMARAHAEGKDELKKYGIVIQDTADGTRGFARVLEEVEKRVGGIHDEMPQAVRDANELSKAWNDVKKAVGGAALEMAMYIKSGGMDARMRGEVSQIEGIRNFKPGASALGAAGAAGADNLSHLSTSVGEISFVKDKEFEAEQKRWADEAEKHKIFLAKQRDEEIKLREETVQSDMEWDEKGLTSWKQVQEEKKKTGEELELVLKTAAKDVSEMEKVEFEKRLTQYEAYLNAQRVADQKRLAEVVDFWAKQTAVVKQYTNQLVSMVADALAKELTSNTKYSRAMFELKVKEETQGMSQENALKRRTELEKQLGDAKVAAFEKSLAESLASIAKEAAMKSIFFAAEAVGDFAEENYAGGFRALEAAGLYAGVAAAAGGGAAIISSARGMTSDEQQSLADAQKSKQETAAREQKQSLQRQQEVSASVNVYYLGITGQTELEQAKELTRIQAQYNALKTGSGRGGGRG